MSPKYEDCTEINDRILKTSIQGNSGTYYNVDPVYYDDKSGERLLYYRVSEQFITIRLPPHTLNLKFNSIVIFFILQKVENFTA